MIKKIMKITLSALISLYGISICDARTKHGHIKKNKKTQTTTEVQTDNFKSNIINIKTDKEFEKLIKSQHSKLIVVDFFTTWCPSCTKMEPTNKSIAEHFGKKIVFIKIDADKVQNLAKKYEIKGYPTYVFIKGDSVVDRQFGSMSQETFTTKVSNLLGGKYSKEEKNAPAPHPSTSKENKGWFSGWFL